MSEPTHWLVSYRSRRWSRERGADVERNRASLLNIEWSTMPPAAGHVMTPRDHLCGEFKDSFDWSSLPPHYLRQIGWPRAAEPGCPKTARP
jgi:hypothetical protein